MSEDHKKDHISALRHWARLFREGTMSDEYADEIAYLLEDKAHDLETDLRKGNL